MTLTELAKMRRLRYRPEWPIHITDNSAIHLFCITNDFPVILLQSVSDADEIAGHDWAPLRNLDVVVVGTLPPADCTPIRNAKPNNLRVLGFFGYRQLVKEAKCS